jgi:hypothetical protein
VLWTINGFDQGYIPGCERYKLIANFRRGSKPTHPRIQQEFQKEMDSKETSEIVESLVVWVGHKWQQLNVPKGKRNSSAIIASSKHTKKNSVGERKGQAERRSVTWEYC